MNGIIKEISVMNFGVADFNVVRVRKAYEEREGYRPDKVEIARNRADVRRFYVDLVHENPGARVGDLRTGAAENNTRFEERILSKRFAEIWNERFRTSESKLQADIVKQEDGKTYVEISYDSRSIRKISNSESSTSKTGMIFDERTVIRKIPTEDIERFITRVYETTGALLDIAL